MTTFRTKVTASATAIVALFGVVSQALAKCGRCDAPPAHHHSAAGKAAPTSAHMISEVMARQFGRKIGSVSAGELEAARENKLDLRIIEERGVITAGVIQYAVPEASGFLGRDASGRLTENYRGNLTFVASTQQGYLGAFLGPVGRFVYEAGSGTGAVLGGAGFLQYGIAAGKGLLGTRVTETITTNTDASIKNIASGAGSVAGAGNTGGNSGNAFAAISTKQVYNQQQISTCVQNNNGSLGASGNGSGAPTQGCQGATVAGPYAGQINASGSSAVSPGTNSAAYGGSGQTNGGSGQAQDGSQNGSFMIDETPKAREIHEFTKRLAAGTRRMTYVFA